MPSVPGFLLCSASLHYSYRLLSGRLSRSLPPAWLHLTAGLCLHASYLGDISHPSTASLSVTNTPSLLLSARLGWRRWVRHYILPFLRLRGRLLRGWKGQEKRKTRFVHGYRCAATLAYSHLHTRVVLFLPQRISLPPPWHSTPSLLYWARCGFAALPFFYHIGIAGHGAAGCGAHHCATAHPPRFVPLYVACLLLLTLPGCTTLRLHTSLPACLPMSASLFHLCCAFSASLYLPLCLHIFSLCLPCLPTALTSCLGPSRHRRRRERTRLLPCYIPHLPLHAFCTFTASLYYLSPLATYTTHHSAAAGAAAEAAAQPLSVFHKYMFVRRRDGWA